MLWDELKERIQIKHKKKRDFYLIWRTLLCWCHSSHWTEILPSYVIPGSECVACLPECMRQTIDLCRVFPCLYPRRIARQLPTLYIFTRMYQRQNGELPLTRPHFSIKYPTSSPGIQEHYLRASSAKCSHTNNFEAICSGHTPVIISGSPWHRGYGDDQAQDHTRQTPGAWKMFK